MHEVQVRKKYLVPFEPIEWLKNMHTALSLGAWTVCSRSFVCPRPSFITKYSRARPFECRKKHLPILAACSFKGRRNLKNPIHTLIA